VVAALSAAWPLGQEGKQPLKTPVEQQVLALRQKLPAFGAARLKREFDLPLSHMAMQRIWREHGLLKPRKKKYQRKQDLAHIKAQWALFQQISGYQGSRRQKDWLDTEEAWSQPCCGAHRSRPTFMAMLDAAPQDALARKQVGAASSLCHVLRRRHARDLRLE